MAQRLPGKGKVMYEIKINALHDNDLEVFAVKIGCRTYVYLDSATMWKELSTYLNATKLDKVRIKVLVDRAFHCYDHESVYITNHPCPPPTFTFESTGQEMSNCGSAGCSDLCAPAGRKETSVSKKELVPGVAKRGGIKTKG